MATRDWSPMYASRLQAGIAVGQFWVGGDVDPAGFARLEAFVSDVERKSQNVAGFITASDRGRTYSPGRVMAIAILGDHFRGDWPAAAAFWDDFGGDIDDHDFVVGFAQGALDSR